MRSELLSELLAIARGKTLQKTPVTPVPPVTEPRVTGVKSLKLQELHGLQVKTDQIGKREFDPVTVLVTDKGQSDEGENEERAGLAIGGVPDLYIDAWALLQVQKPLNLSVLVWRLGIDDAGLFLDEWGGLAEDFQWPPNDFFDVPGEGKPGGLTWFLQGERVQCLGPEHAVTERGRVFDRLSLK